MIEPAHDKKIKIDGFCPICRMNVTFFADGEWYRDQLFCPTCTNGSVPRERALALVLEELVPHWRDCAIHESSPMPRGISLKLREQGPRYVESHFIPGRPLGETIGAFQNEDLQKLTFADDTHDLFISLDVFEHLPFPHKALKEIHRTLKPGGLMICTFPVKKAQVAPIERRVEYAADGSEIHVKPVEIHGNPVNAEGSIVTVDYGYDLHTEFAKIAPFDVRVYRFHDRRHGIIGEYTEVIVCRKRV